MKKILLFAIILLGMSSVLQAQYTLSGYVKDAKTKDALIGASVIYNDSILVTTDINGFYTITAPVIKRLQIQYLGYDNYTKRVKFDDDSTAMQIDVLLKLKSSILTTVVVTGSNYEKNIVNEPTSIEVIKPAYLERNNIVSLENLMERVPGIQVADGQASIRSSGFSQGAGSRVAIIVNGLPMLGGEGSDIRWNLIPIENTAQIEVIKGAGSVLYGSAAMNGVINVLTAWPTSEPRTNISVYTGISDSPEDKYKYRQWWDGVSEAPNNRGIFLSHRQKIGKLDLVFGGNAHQTVGLVQNNDDERYRFNVNTRYRVSDSLVFELSANAMYNSQMSYLSWQDGDTNVLQPLDSLFQNVYYNYTVDPSLTYYDKKGGRHILRGRYFNTTYERRRGLEYIPVYMLYGEYQYQRRFAERFSVTGGGSYQKYFATSPNFGRDTITGEFITATAAIGSLYGQLESHFFNEKLNIILGGRAEFINAGVDDYPSVLPVFRFSSTYKFTKKDIARFSIGQGYRFPSLAERFVSQTLVEVSLPPLLEFSFGLQPNPTLRPEYGWSAEVGYKKVLKNDTWQGYFDFAAFAIRYNDMVYLTLDYHKDVGGDVTINDLIADPTPFGYKYVNLENTLVSGFEISTTMNGRIGSLPFRVWSGYTYTYPGNLDTISARNESYMRNFFKAFTLKDRAVAPSILTYRSLHVARFDIEFYLKKLTIGFTTNVDGYMENIDPILEGKGYWGPFVQFLGGEFLLPGVVSFRENNPRYNWIFDLKMAYKLNDHHNFNFVLSNITNRMYAFRPGRINPLRSFNFRYAFTF
jgi:outer membrane receptor protein involved in Fe transport